MIYGNLGFEVTRRCNLSCSHCIKGDAEQIDMSKYIVDKTLSEFSYITELSFSGGEPLLNGKLIQYIVNRIIELNIPVDSFICVTNGLIYDNDTINSLLKLHRWTNRPYYNKFGISIDKYHTTPISQCNLNKYKQLPFYSSDWERDYDYGIISEGRGEQFNNSIKINYKPEFGAVTYINGDIYCSKMLLIYICANGNVIFDCALSYKHEDCYGNINILNNSICDFFYQFY